MVGFAHVNFKSFFFYISIVSSMAEEMLKDFVILSARTMMPMMDENRKRKEL